MISEAAFDCWTTHVVLRCVVLLFGLLNALGIIQSVQGQDAAESRFTAPATEIEISTGSEPEEVAPRIQSSQMVSNEASPQVPECPSVPGPIWREVQEGTTCQTRYSCGGDRFGSYVYIHHVYGTAERGKDVLVTGPDSLRTITWVGQRVAYGSDRYEALSDGIPEGDEEMDCYCGKNRDGPVELDYAHRVRILDVDGWTVSDATANESHGNMTFLLEFPQPVARDLTVKYSTKDGTAKAGTDYTRTKGSVTVRKGQIRAYIGVPLVKDQISEGTETFELVTISDQFSGIPEQKATGTIVEGSHLIIEPSPLSVDEGGQNTYTIALSEQPGGDVMVAITGYTGTDLALNKTSLTFTPANWHQGQTVTVTAGEDADAIDERETLMHTATAPGGLFDGVSESLWVTITDKYAIRLIVTPNHLDLVEEDSGQAFRVKLGSSPPVGKDVTVAVNVGPRLDGKVTLSEPQLTFTSSNWSTDQSVTVTAESDADGKDEAGTLDLSASGGGYSGQSQTGYVSVIVDDDDRVQLVVAPRSLSLVEGGSGKGFTVRLGSAPVGNDVTVFVDIPWELDGKVSMTKPILTFTSSDWDENQSVTVTAEGDGDVVDEAGTLDLSVIGGGYGGQTSDVFVRVDDDDTVQLVVAPTTLSLVEGGSGKGVAVRLGSAPVGNDVTVQVNIPPGLAGKVSLSDDNLTFTSSNWSTDQSVTVTAEGDGDAADEAGTLGLSASGGGYDGQTGDVSVTVDDDEIAQLVVAPLTVSLVEGGSGKEFKVKLGSSPLVGEDVMVAVSIPPELDGKVALTVPHLTFVSSNWSTDQSVTVTAEGDADATDEAGTLGLAASGGGYDGINGRVSVDVTDNDTPGLVLSNLSLTIQEGGSRDYTVRLATQPTEAVTVSITGTGVTMSPSRLTFTGSTWDTAQTVTVTAPDDDDATNESVILAHAASGGDYGSVSKDLPVMVTDDDTPGLRTAPTALTVIEGVSGTYRVRLETKPTGTVTVSVKSDNSAVTTSATSLTFTSSDWAAEQTVMVRAAEDADTDDDSATLAHTASGGDYDSVTGAVTVAVKDNDSPAGLVVWPAYLPVPEGAEKHFRVRLLTEPTQTVDVRITGDAGTDVMVNPRMLRYTSEDWSMPVSVTVRAYEDDNTMDASVRLTLSASGGEYNGEAEEVFVAVQDNDIAGIVLSPTELEIVEGDAESYTVRLMAEPSGTVIVRIASDSPEVTVSDASLTFTPDDWYAMQAVMVHADEDDDTDNDRATLTHRASGAEYDGVEEELMVTVLDDDEAGLVVRPAAVALVEGDAGKTLTVSLATPPSGQVTVSLGIESALDGKVSVSPLGLTFMPADWSARQTVMVTPLDDANGADEFGKLQLSASGGNYSGESGSVEIAVRDDDVPHRLGLANSSVLVSEGAGPARFQVRLNRQSITAVTVRYHTQDGSATMGSDYEQTSGVLTFAAGDLEKEVPVQIIDDALHEEEETFTLELTDAQGAELGMATGRATITDNDAGPTVSMVPAVYVREGGTAKVYLRLSSTSTKPVTVSYSTRDVTATAGEDYEEVSAGSVTIEPGEMGAVIQVSTQDDAMHEGREAFVVQLDGGGQTNVTILDNDHLPQLSIGDVTVSEDGGRAKLAVSLSGTSAVRIGVAYATHDGTAEAGADYTRTMGTLVFAPGETVRHVWVPVARDDVVEEDEGLVVRLNASEHAMLLDAEGDVTIKDDPIEVSIHDGTGTESSDELVMAVRLNYGSTKVVSVQFAVTGGTATSDVDYEATQGLVVFETGSTEAQVRIPLIDDDLQEGNETIEVTLSNPTNTQIGQAMATGTVVDDETAPGVQVRAIAVSQTEAVFVVGLLAPVAERLTGRYRTVTARHGRERTTSAWKGYWSLGLGRQEKRCACRYCARKVAGRRLR